MGLIGGLILFLVYVLLVFVFFRYLFAPILFGGSLLLLCGAPYLFFQSLQVTFRVERRGWVPIAALGLFVAGGQLNILAMFCGVFHLVLPGTPGLEPTWFFLLEAQSYLPLQSILNTLMLGDAVPTAPDLSYHLISLLARTLCLYPLLLFTNGTQGTLRPDSAQPARTHYLFHKAFLDLKDLALSAYVRCVPLVMLGVRGVMYLFRNEAVIATWILGVTAAFLLVIPTLATALALGLMILILAVTIGLSFGGTWVVGFAFRMGEWLFMWLRWGFAKCPHCYNRIKRPVAQCPECGVKHSHLEPGHFGFLRRRCQCDRAWLPTLLVLGKTRKIPNYCPHCDEPLSRQVFARNLHVPLIGGPTAGKTTLLMAYLMELMNRAAAPLEVQLVEDSDRALFEDVWRPGYEAGIPAAKTQDIAPNALLLDVDMADLKGEILYLYDMAGEAVQREESLGRHHHLQHAAGILLILDPFSIAGVRKEFGARLDAADFQVSHQPPHQVFEQLVRVLINHDALRRGRPCHIPIAVVIPKVDAFDLAQEMGIELRRDHLGDWKESGIRDSDRIRTWLCQHDGNLVRGLESQFTRVRYFAISAFGAKHRTGKRFRPMRVLQPLTWLLSHHLKGR